MICISQIHPDGHQDVRGRLGARRIRRVPLAQVTGGLSDKNLP